jgi:hypothetical protein
MRVVAHAKKYDIKVTQYKNKLFAVRYGKQVKMGLSYTEAAHEFGECAFHALACAGKLDNSGE